MEFLWTSEVGNKYVGNMADLYPGALLTSDIPYASNDELRLASEKYIPHGARSQK